MLLTCLLPFLATKASRVLEKKVNETEVSKTVFSHLKTNICLKSKALKANMPVVLRTSNFQEATIRKTVLRHKLSVVFIVHPVPVQNHVEIFSSFLSR